MDCKQDQQIQRTAEQQHSSPSASPGKEPWEDPKLVFVEPKLTAHGKLEEVTGAVGPFFTTFHP